MALIVMGALAFAALSSQASDVSARTSGATARASTSGASARVSDVSARHSGASALGTPAHASTTTLLRGVNIPGVYNSFDGAGADRLVAAAQKLHAKVVRAEVPWSTLEPTSANEIAPGALAYTDRLVSDAAAAGIRVIMTVDSSPCWASSAPASVLARCGHPNFALAGGWPPRDPGDYAAIVAYLASRYGARLAAIEVWNEPDQSNQLYFGGPEKIQRYANLLRAAYPAIKQANASVSVLAGSLVGANGKFLDGLYAAGIKGYYDGLAVHFYTLTLASLRTIHEVQLAHGDTKPLWLDEFGWSSCYPKHKLAEEQACVTTAVQGQNLASLFDTLSRTRWVAAALFFNLQDSATEYFGVVNFKGIPKPAYALVRKVMVNPFGRPPRVVLGLSTRHGRVRASGSGPVGDYMELEAHAPNGLIYRTLFVLNRFNRYAITLPRALGSHGLRVSVYQYWAGSKRATHAHT
jgi:hypothetical protein